MFDYSEVKRSKGYSVNQTLDSPIMVFEIWELSEVLIALFEIFTFGILFSEWLILSLFLILTLFGLPVLRKRFNKGFALHYPYRKFGVSLPGLIPLRNKAKFSD